MEAGVHQLLIKETLELTSNSKARKELIRQVSGNSFLSLEDGDGNYVMLNDHEEIQCGDPRVLEREVCSLTLYFEFAFGKRTKGKIDTYKTVFNGDISKWEQQLSTKLITLDHINKAGFQYIWARYSIEEGDRVFVDVHISKLPKTML